MNPFRMPAERENVESPPPKRERRPRHYPIGAFMNLWRLRDLIACERAAPGLIALSLLLIIALILARSR